MRVLQYPWGGVIYVMGGFDGSRYLSSVEVFSPISQEWTSLSHLQNKRHACAAVSMGGQIYVMGDFDGDSYLSSMEVFSPFTREWISLPQMQTKRRHCAAVSMGGQIYVIGGHDGAKDLSSMEVFNPISRECTMLPSMQTKRNHCAAVSIGGQIYVIGGYDGSSYLSSVEVFSPASGKWTFLPHMITKRSHCAAVSMMGQIYAIGGHNGSDRLSSMELLRVEPDSFEACANPQPRTPHTRDITTQQEMAQQHSSSMEENVDSEVDQLLASSQIPQTLQLLQSKIPTANFIPVATEVVLLRDDASSVPYPAAAAVAVATTTLSFITQHLINASTEDVCTWLANKHGISKTSLDILQRENIYGSFLFRESHDEIKNVLREEGMRAGQISRIRFAVENAKRDGALT